MTARIGIALWHGKKCEIMTQTTNYDFSIISHNDVLVIDIIDIGQKYQFELLSHQTLDKGKWVQLFSKLHIR